MRKGSITARLAIFVVVAVVLGAAAWIVFKRERPPNIILISIDTLRPDRMGVYGHRPMGRSTTPFLDELAGDGALFSNAVSTSSWTLPAHYSLMTGLPDQAHGMVNDRVPLPDGIPMLAEILRDEGYATAGYYSGSYLSPVFGFDKGFDVYTSCMPSRDAAGARRPGSGNSGDGPRTRFAAHEMVTSETVSEQGLAFVKDWASRGSGKPFFLFLHYFDVHNDYLPPPPFDSRFGPPYHGWVNGRGVTSDSRYNEEMQPEDLDRLRALYDGEIAWVDSNIERLYRGIASLDADVIENTLIIVTSDHGEEFFEHGFSGHRKNLFQSSVSIPLLMVGPQRIGKGVTVDACATIYDIFPTLIDLLDMEGRDAPFGRSLMPAIRGDDVENLPALLDLTGIPKDDAYLKRTGLLHGRYKLICEETKEWAPADPFSAGDRVIEETIRLFDLGEDPGEESDISSAKAATVKRMLEVKKVLLERAASSASRKGEEGAQRNDIPDDLRRSLQELGYSGGGR